MNESKSSRKESSITFLPMKTGTTRVNKETENSTLSTHPRKQSQAIRKTPRMKI